jgi:phosphoglycerate dehydrogenase-like enzyme
MKAVFLNDGFQTYRVYTDELREEMAKHMDLYPDVVRRDEMDGHAAALREAEAVFSTWGMPALTEEEIEKYLPNLRAVFYGAGTVQYFARPFLARGVKVCSAWAANGVAVADYTQSVIRLALKGFFPAERAAAADWNAMRMLVERYPGCYGSAAGLLGFGMIGRLVAERLAGGDIRVVAYDPYAPDEAFEQSGVRRASTMEEIFSGCDVVSNHIANLPATREILRYEHFSLMSEYGVFINTGRNAQVHVPGFMRAFTEVPTRTALFDVTDPDEPPGPGNPLLSLPNAYFTPHMAGATGREVRRMGAYMLEEFIRYGKGEPLRWEVTEKMLATMA